MLTQEQQPGQRVVGGVWQPTVISAPNDKGSKGEAFVCVRLPQEHDGTVNARVSPHTVGVRYANSGRQRVLAFAFGRRRQRMNIASQQQCLPITNTA